MVERLTDLTSEILWAVDIVSARTALDHALTVAGVPFYAYANFRPGAETPYCDTTYPAAWLECYVRRNYLRIDPVVIEARRNHLPFAWRYVTNRTGNLAPEQRQLFAEAAAHGLCDGYSIPFHDHSGCVAIMSFAFASTEDMKAVLTAHPHLRMLAVHYHAAIERMLEIEQDEATLSPIERQCLQEAAQGRSLWEISAATHRPEGDVASALRAAREKLGTATTAQAAEMAIAMGLIGAE